MAEGMGFEPTGLLRLTRVPGGLLSHSVNPLYMKLYEIFGIPGYLVYDTLLNVFFQDFSDFLFRQIKFFSFPLLNRICRRAASAPRKPVPHHAYSAKNRAAPRPLPEKLRCSGVHYAFSGNRGRQCAAYLSLL